MAILDEQLVEEWLNRQNFFTIRGIKLGIDEIDLLALKQTVAAAEYRHVEVQVSFRPIGYIGGDTNARRRNDTEIRAGVEQWVNKKFTSPNKVAKRNNIVPGAEWRYFLIHGVLRDESELTYMKELGVEPIPYIQVLNDLRNDTSTLSSSIASNIVDILRYLRE